LELELELSAVGEELLLLLVLPFLLLMATDVAAVPAVVDVAPAIIVLLALAWS